MSVRRNRLLRRFVVGVALLSAALALFHALLLPAIARGRVKQALRDAGAPISSFEIERVGLNELRLTNIRLGEHVWLSASAIDIHYGFDLLWTGHLRTIEIHDPEWTITRDARGIHIGPQFEGTSGQRVDRIDLPFEHLIVTDGSALFQGFPALDRADFNLTIDRRSEAKAAAHLQIASIRVENSTLSGADVMLELDGNSVHAAADWQPIANAVINLRANVTVGEQGIYGELIADLQPFEIEDAGDIAALVPALSNYTIAGAWSGYARITLDDGTVTPLIRLTADHASLG